MKCTLRWQLTHIYREIRRRHQWSYELFNSLSTELRAEDMNMGVRIKKRSKEGEAQQMIAVPMCNKERCIKRLPFGALLQLRAQAHNATACIKNERMLSDLHLNAGS